MSAGAFGLGSRHKRVAIGVQAQRFTEETGRDGLARFESCALQPGAVGFLGENIDGSGVVENRIAIRGIRPSADGERVAVVREARAGAEFFKHLRSVGPEDADCVIQRCWNGQHIRVGATATIATLQDVASIDPCKQRYWQFNRLNAGSDVVAHLRKARGAVRVFEQAIPRCIIGIFPGEVQRLRSRLLLRPGSWCVSRWRPIRHQHHQRNFHSRLRRLKG